jgi:hypothetical protein
MEIKMKILSGSMTLVLAVAVLIFGLSVPALATPPISFSADAPVVKVGEGGNSSTWSSGQHSISSMGDNVYGAWCDSTVKFSMSADGGGLWGPMKSIGANCGSGASLAVGSDGTIHVVWDQSNSPNPTTIMYSQSINNGTSWSTPVSVNGSTAGDWAASVAVDSNGNIHVAWHSRSPYDIYDSVSTDDGEHWTSYQVNPSASYYGDAPSIAVDGSDYVYIAWECEYSSQYEVCFSKSTNGGSSWLSTPTVVTGSYAYGMPSIAVSSDGDVYIAWGDGVNDKVVTASLASGGSTWGYGEVTSSTGVLNIGTNRGVSPNGDVNVAYYVDDTSAGCSGSLATFFSRSTNGGSSFGSRVFIDCESTFPTITIDQNDKAVVMWGGSVLQEILSTREQ